MAKIRVADYIADYLYNIGVKYVFMIPGAGSMVLNDAVTFHKKLKYICCHHEQALALAALGYAEYTGKLGVVTTTSGCGGTNAITGVLNAYQDNVPVLIISGQIKYKDTIRNSGLKLKQFGVQEADIIPMVKPITKFAEMVTDANEIKYYLDKAINSALYDGVPGPVWLNIPLDVQSAIVESPPLEACIEPHEFDFAKNYETHLETALCNHKRPIVIAGHGIRLSGTIDKFREFIENSKIPFVTTKLGTDVLPFNHPLYVGKIGTKGDRAGNFAVQNADLIISLGSRLSLSTIGLDYEKFTREAERIVVDINDIEHKKKTIKIDWFLKENLNSFFLNMYHREFPLSPQRQNWIKMCQKWKAQWPAYLPKYSKTKEVNLYYFMELLSQKLRPDDVIVGDAGSSMFVTVQGIKTNSEKQRVILSGGQTQMGFVLPVCVGIGLAKQGEVIGITGDGSLQMNIHELQTIKHHNLPIKLFIWNNNGYLSIRKTQTNFFGRAAAVNPQTGVSFPDLKKIAYAYGIKYFKAKDSESLSSVMDRALAYKGPAICEVMCLYDQDILTVTSKQLPDGKFVSCPFEDMYPFLDRKEFYENMIVKPVNQ